MSIKTEALSRTELLIGREGIMRLKRARVAVFGLGGVGSFVTEALTRSGIGHLDLIDNDTVALSNLNRQIIATRETIGKKKTEVMKERVLSVFSDTNVTTHDVFYLPETADAFDFSQYDYVVDAIDTVSGKIALIMQAAQAKIPIISSMGAGNKLDPTAFEVDDLFKTSVCPLAKVMRRELKSRGIRHMKVVYSKEEAIKNGTRVPGSIAFVPSVAGLIIAGEVIKDLTGKSEGMIPH